MTSQQSGHGASSLIEPTERASPVIEPKRAASLIEPTEQVGASPTIKRAAPLIEPTERASPVVELHASIVTDRAQVGASPTTMRASSLIEPRLELRQRPACSIVDRAHRVGWSIANDQAPLIEPTERASPVVELHASIVTDRAQVGASPTTMRASSLIEPRLELRQRPSVQHR